MSDSPPFPFEIEIIESVRNYAAEMARAHEDFQWRWDAVVELLEVAGDELGEPIGTSPLLRAERFQIREWSILVRWQFLNGKVRIIGALF